MESWKEAKGWRRVEETDHDMWRVAIDPNLDCAQMGSSPFIGKPAGAIQARRLALTARTATRVHTTVTDIPGHLVFARKDIVDL